MTLDVTQQFRVVCSIPQASDAPRRRVPGKKITRCLTLASSWNDGRRLVTMPVAACSMARNVDTPWTSKSPATGSRTASQYSIAGSRYVDCTARSLTSLTYSSHSRNSRRRAASTSVGVRQDRERHVFSFWKGAANSR